MWTVITTDLFNEWLAQQDQSTQEKVLAALVVLQQQGPSLGRPLVDTVYDSKFTNMKELRVQHRGKPLRAFSRLILYDKLLCCVSVIKAVKSVFIKRC
ncbi:diaminopimelate decarboxylase [Acinetobacter nosocomialis]|nr:diaminopimelate decarboxylase [Acinetobacter nosocomialis]SSP88698.1 diaminopimelate decarboxylase [Acinetobacter nosocomialis]